MAAGLAAGGFALRDPFPTATSPAPGIPEAQAPLAWYDSVVVTLGEGAAWRGFGAALVDARGIVLPSTNRKPRSVWTVVNGSDAIDRNGLFVSRGDGRSWLRGGAVAGERGGVGDLDLSGDHFWTFGLGARRGAHVFEGAFAQRGIAESQRVGYAEAAKGESGFGAWSWGDSLAHLSARLSRAHDARESFGAGAVVPYSRRDAQSNAGELEAVTRRGATELGARLEVREGVVENWIGAPDVVYRWRERSVWAAVRAARPLGPGRLELQLGAGRHDAAARRRERLQAAPGLAWRAGGERRSLRLFGERLVVPVWSDLAPGTPAFVQDTWIGGFEARAAGAAGRAGLTVAGGTTGNRALLYRIPVRDIALRLGWQREGSRYAFTLASADAATHWRALGLEGSGFLLARDGDTGQPRVDPAVGGTAALTTAFTLFSGDLPVHLRGQAAWVGARSSQPSREGFDTGLGTETLDGYATYSAVVRMGLGDATFVLRADGLEDVRHEETWPDFTDPFQVVLARDSGRTFRFEMIWPLFN